MQKKIIGLVGTIASGKGVIADFLSDRGFTVYKLSDVLRRISEANGIPVTRENLQNLGNQLRQERGASALIELTLLSLPEDVEFVAIDGLRNPGEISYLREHSVSLVLGVDAPTKSRLKWYMRRSFDRGEDLGSYADFYLSNSRNLGAGEAVDGQQVGKSLEMVDVAVYNSGTKEELLELVESVLESRQFLSIEGRRRSVEK